MTVSQLATPGKLVSGGLRVTPLGGLGDIGRNMTVFEYGGRLLIVDCGVLFPGEEHPGVDLILPDFTSLAGRWDQVEALVLTHGHEDHIGGVPYLLEHRADIPIVGSQLTLALVDPKLREHRIKNSVKQVVAEGERIRFGPFDLEFVAVNHSIPDALAVVIRTKAGMVLHTGDFKMDQLPLDGRLTDLRAFARLGEEGVDLFLVDSTNAEIPGFNAAEQDITPVMDQVFANSSQRVIVACFASHIHRVQQVLDIAARHGRKVAYVGRSMVRNMAIATELGYLSVPPGLIVDIKELASLPPEKIVLISTGSQGEPLSALSRIAHRSHHIVELEEGDTVILASSLIPGNETAIYRVINGLTALGATVVHTGNAFVHVSGHASAGELLYCYNILQPRNVLPVHGEVRHLKANAEIAISAGVASDQVVIASDGDVIDLVDGKAKIAGRVEADYIFVDGPTVGDLTEDTLKDRRILGEDGFISVLINVDFDRKQLVGSPTIIARGFHHNEETFAPIRQPIVDAVRQALNEDLTDPYQVQQRVRRVLGRWVNKTLRARPMIVPVVTKI